ncbi:PIN domain-containing protein [Methylophilus sp. 5]|uniref:PIN domain-containing protein n=1 Tax=Methylophilus sp. 5 TaxID=1112274 RepID=UPI00048C73B0|nr:PIN domain-containing protein [Methylophilus sp. 5]
MKNIFVDSTEFKNDKSRATFKFSQLSTLAKSHLIKLHTSIINVKEFESTIDEDFRLLNQSIIDGVSKATKYLLQDINQQSLQNLINSSEHVINQSAGAAKNKFNSWLTENHVEIHKIGSTDAQNAFDCYFSGSEPFKKLKNRDDLPDAFIWQVLLRLNSKFKDKLYFISKDKNFQEKVRSNLKSFIVIESLDELFERAEIKTCIEQDIASKRTRQLDDLICLIKTELKVQKQDISVDISKLVKKELLGSNYSDYSEHIYGDVTEVNFTDNINFEVQNITFDEYPTVYIISENHIDITVTNSLPAHGFWDGAYTPSAFSRIIEISENSTDTHNTIHNDILLEVKSEFVIELPSLTLCSDKNNVIDAFENGEINLVKLTKLKI